MYGERGRLDRELIDWRAGAVIADLYQEIYQRLGDHPLRGSIQLVQRLHAVRRTVHGLSPDTAGGSVSAPVHPDGLWDDLRQRCEDAGWELSRLQLAGTKARRAQGQRLEGTGMREAQKQRPEDARAVGSHGQGLEDVGSIADQDFGEVDL